MSHCQLASEAIDFRGASECFAWQFHDTHQGSEKIATLLRPMPWSSNLHVLDKCGRTGEREFYALTEFAPPLEAASRCLGYNAPQSGRACRTRIACPQGSGRGAIYVLKGGEPA